MSGNRYRVLVKEGLEELGRNIVVFYLPASVSSTDYGGSTISSWGVRF